MNILIIEDDLTHQEAARITLAEPGCHLDFAGSFQEGLWKLDTPETKEKMKKLYRNEVFFPSYDAVLTDLLLPENNGGREKHPYGFVLAIRAIRIGVPFVLMLTEKGHHDHPMSHAMGFAFEGEVVQLSQSRVGFFDPSNRVGFIQMQGICDVCFGAKKTLCSECNGTSRVMYEGKECYCSSCKEGMKKCIGCRGTGKRHGKNWKAALDQLLQA